jgi:hypothetical protein
MKKYILKIQALTFLTILIFATFCNGQEKELSKEKVLESKIISEAHKNPKLTTR